MLLYPHPPTPTPGSADHNCVHLLPTYNTALKREKVQIKEVKVWSDESELCLQECFNCTDWDMFKQSTGDLDEVTDVICSYVTFCRDIIVSSKRVKKFTLAIGRGSLNQ